MAKSKKIAIVVAAIALIAVIGVVGSTLAYFTDTDTKTNTFTTGKISGKLLEKDPTDPKGTKIVDGSGIHFDNVMPGDNLVKEPFVQLDDGSRDAYVRIKTEWITPDDWSDAQKSEFNNKKPDLNYTQDWVDGGDNYYYYVYPIKANEPTPDIFNKVIIPGADWTNVMTNTSFSLKIDAEFIQAENTDDVVVKDANQKVIKWQNITSDKITQYPVQ